MNDLISIIVPIYNVEKYLDKCIKSIINQTYKNIEIILINDGSTDLSEDICIKYRDLDRRIILISKENTGVSATRNLGIEISNGEYICFIDSDDYIEIDYIEILYNKIIENNCDAVRCNYTKESLKKKYEGKLYGLENKLLDKRIINSELLDKIICGDIDAFTVLLLIKKSKLIKIKFNKDIRLMEDTIFYVNLLCYINTIYIYSRSLYHYNLNELGATNNPNNYLRNFYEINKVNMQIKRILQENQLDSIERINILDTFHTIIKIDLIFLLIKNKRINMFNEFKKIINSELDKYKYEERNINNQRLTIHIKIGLMLSKKKYWRTLYIYLKMRVFASRVKDMLEEREK